ncbi:MAG: hypothetical protein KJP18_15380 [Gemmatimonadetes bacterium]|nr:hypothetical protein [Gemmatimonadota bacterium]
MPSDARVRTALDALSAPREAFRSAVATADEEIRAARNRIDEGRDPADALARELGPFAIDRIDPARLAGLMQVEAAADPVVHHLLDTAHRVFEGLASDDGTGFQVELTTGGDLRDAVRDALAGRGRAFGVAHAVEKARAHRYQPDADHVLLQPYPFHRWSAGERGLAPPLVVALGGADLRAGSLSEFLDGSVRIALVVRGATSPAPLARLIGHGVFVAQTTDAAALERLAAHDGPGVVAWVESGSGAVEFVHDPSAGDRTWERLTIEGGVEGLQARLAELEGPGGRRVPAADLRHLLELATAPTSAAPTAATTAGAAPAPTGDDAADRLAAWLLARTDLDGI